MDISMDTHMDTSIDTHMDMSMDIHMEMPIKSKVSELVRVLHDLIGHDCIQP